MKKASGHNIFLYKVTAHGLLVLIFALQLCSCSVSKQIGKQATEILLKDSSISTGHCGISIYEPAKGKYWYNYNADKYFVPASNVKLFTLYAGMKYLGDSLTAAKYSLSGGNLFILPTGDPTFLHPDFDNHPLLDLIREKADTVFIWLRSDVKKYGEGWSWDDFDQNYMTEKSKFPIYGNQLWLSAKPMLPKSLSRDTLIDAAKYLNGQWMYVKPKYFADSIFRGSKLFGLRNLNKNKFYIDSSNGIKSVPFITDNGTTQFEILHHLTGKTFRVGADAVNKYQILKSHSSDSLFKPMVQYSDNFFAEQTLLMVSNEHIGNFDNEAIIDTLLKSDLKDIPQQPRWVDGSGLSRYNLFTPQSFVYILSKMKNEFGMERLKSILPTGGEGTLKNYYNSDSGFVFAKTGSLGNQVALSGFVITQKNKLLIFSILVNNEMGSGSSVRRAIERFIKSLRSNY